jgi:multimeric flavodoxin WrbA
MKNFKQMVYKNLFEAKGQKPDFLDLDKDGDKEEPMKKAAEEEDDSDEEEALAEAVMRRVTARLKRLNIA